MQLKKKLTSGLFSTLTYRRGSNTNTNQTNTSQRNLCMKWMILYGINVFQIQQATWCTHEKNKSGTSLLFPERKAWFVRHGDGPEVMELSRTRWRIIVWNDARNIKRQPKSRGWTVLRDEEWKLKDERWDTVNTKRSQQHGTGDHAALRTEHMYNIVKWKIDINKKENPETTSLSPQTIVLLYTLTTFVYIEWHLNPTTIYQSKRISLSFSQMWHYKRPNNRSCHCQQQSTALHLINSNNMQMTTTKKIHRTSLTTSQ